MGAIFLEAWAKPLLVLHAVMAAALLGSVTHASYEVIQYLKGRPRRPDLEKLHAKIIVVLYGAQVTLGALIYPTYRVNVRDQYFDVHLPWATQWFEIKEVFAALGLATAVAYFLLSRIFDPGAAEHKKMRPLVAFCCLTTAGIVWFNSLTGFFLTTFRGL